MRRTDKQLGRTGLSSRLSRLSRIVTNSHEFCYDGSETTDILENHYYTDMTCNAMTDPRGELGGARLLFHLSTSLYCVKAVAMFR